MTEGRAENMRICCRGDARAGQPRDPGDSSGVNISCANENCSFACRGRKGEVPSPVSRYEQDVLVRAPRDIPGGDASLGDLERSRCEATCDRDFLGGRTPQARFFLDLFTARTYNRQKRKDVRGRRRSDK